MDYQELKYRDVVFYFSEPEQKDLAGMGKWFKGVGVVMLAIGVLAVILPHVATLTVEILAACILLVSGITQMAHAFQMRKWRRITWEVLVGVLFLITGALFLLHPFSGALALTFLLGIFFFVLGGFKVPFALAWRPRPGWGWLLAGGVLSLLLGLMVVFGLPGTAAWVIGILLGIDLIFSGFALAVLGSKLKSLSENRVL